jgi:hypothetical protein
MSNLDTIQKKESNPDMIFDVIPSFASIVMLTKG